MSSDQIPSFSIGEESLAKKLFGWGIESHETQRGKRKYLPKRPARSSLTLKHADILDYTGSSNIYFISTEKKPMLLEEYPSKL